MPVRRITLYFLVFLLFFIGCGNNKEDINQEQESEVVAVELTLPQIPKIPQGPYKPTSKDIQIALSNAGFYNGKIDGDIGLMTEEAIRKFQEENSLVVDGRIGPKTWVLLSDYLVEPESENIDVP